MISIQDTTETWKAIESKAVVIKPSFWTAWDAAFTRDLEAVERYTQENLNIKPLPMNIASLIDYRLAEMKSTLKTITTTDDCSNGSLLAVPGSVRLLMLSQLRNSLQKAYMFVGEWNSTDKLYPQLLLSSMQEMRSFIERLKKASS